MPSTSAYHILLEQHLLAITCDWLGEHLGIRSSVVLHASASEHVVQVLLPAPVYTCLALSGELDLLQAYLYQNLRNQPFSVFDRKLVLCPTDNGDYEQLPG